MAQRTQVIDITKSYLPGDPNALVQNLVNTDREDGEEKTLPVLPYEGYNFLPTSYGYKSYFGTNATLEISALSSRVQYVLLWQLPNYKSRLIALCEDGIWVATADGYYPNWIQLVEEEYDINVYEEWTWCIIENILYMYKQGKSLIYKTDIGALEFPDIQSTPGGAAGIVGDPTTYQTFTLVEGVDGTDTDIYNGNSYEIRVQYKNEAGQFSEEGTIAALFVVNSDTVSFDISLTGTAPLTGLYARIYIEDDDLEDTFYKDFLLTSFPISISDYTGFVSGTATLPADLPTALEEDTPGFFSFYQDSKFLNGTSEIFGMDANNSGSWESWEEDYNVADLVITSFTPTFLNMVGQMGIFRAGTRLGMWDSANSVSWSSNLDLTDFTPALETLAGNTIFGSVVGRIVLCKGHGEGFLVYSTKSVVGATFSTQGNLLWDAKKVLDNTGISYSRAVTCGKTDSEHFFFGTTGIYAVGKFNALASRYESESILTELYDFLKEARDPVYMDILQDRYLCFSVVDGNYVYGLQSFYSGAADPLTFTIDWYTESDEAPAVGPSGTTTPLGNSQMWEIIRNELMGKSRTKRKDGEWIPLYTTTVDVMDDRYYSWWRQYVGESSGRLSYEAYSTYFDSLPVNLTAGDIETYLNPQRPASPPDAYRYGKLRTSAAIRSRYGLMDGDVNENNETLIWAQENEWTAFIRHQLANKVRLEAYREEVIVSSPTLVLTPGVVIPVADPDYYINTGTWTLTYLGITIATGVWTEKQLKIAPFNRIYINTTGIGDVPPIYTAVPADYNNDYVFNGTGVGATSTGTWTRIAPTPTGIPTVIGTLVTGEGNNEWLTTEGPTEKAAKEVILRRTFNKGFELTKREVYALGSDSITTTTTYETAEVTGTYGYSQFRALVTRWDRTQFGLYGAYEILESVDAEAMTAKIWEGLYPTDQGGDRNSIWTYSIYESQTSVDQATGLLGTSSVITGDPAASPYVDIEVYNNDGLTSWHSSYTLPGSSFFLQTGSISTPYPTFTGAFVFDLHLKKWGKLRETYKLFIETIPINSASSGSITYTDLGANAGIWDSTGYMKLFDAAPLDSWIRFGKIGSYRQGMTNLLEVKAQQRYPNTFDIIVESSLDGKVLNLSTAKTYSFAEEVIAECLPDISARWHTVRVAGNYDLTGLEIRATIASRR